jgi:hypothetical protein
MLRPKVIALFALILPATAFADPKPLSKADAVRILQSMGYQDAKIAFIIQGAVPIAATPNAAMVSAVGYFNGQPKKVEQQFFYDDDLGWFCTEDWQNRVGIRIWSVNGYSEVALAPRNTPPPVSMTTSSTPNVSVIRRQDAEARLNEIYTRVRSRMNDTDKAALKQQQLQWLREREKYTGDSARFTEMTETRIKELEKQLNP